MLAFADAVLNELPDALIIIVDRHGNSGGYWNDGFLFVTLHQPSVCYGVAPLQLGAGQIDTHGLNAGMFELASRPEMSAYFGPVMYLVLLPTSRVRYFPMSEYAGDGRIVSLVSGAETQVRIACKTIDATFARTSVPATHRRKFPWPMRCTSCR